MADYLGQEGRRRRNLVTALLAVLAVCSSALGRPPSVLLVRPRSDHVGLYEKVELIIELDAQFGNPFDPDEIDVQVELTSPSGATRRIWGFFNPTTADSLWMARFSPTEVGQWRYTVCVRDINGAATGEPGTIQVERSPQHGFIKIAPNGRYLRYDDGTAFYGIGLWYNDGPVPEMQGVIQEQQLVELKKRGVNFVCSRIPLLETVATISKEARAAITGRVASHNVFFPAAECMSITSGDCCQTRISYRPISPIGNLRLVETEPFAQFNRLSGMGGCPRASCCRGFLQQRRSFHSGNRACECREVSQSGLILQA